MIVCISLILITLAVVLFLSFGPTNATSKYYMANKPKKAPPNTKKPNLKKPDPKKPDPKKRNPKNPNIIPTNPTTTLEGRNAWDVVEAAALAPQPPPNQPPLNPAILPVNGKCGSGTILIGGKCIPKDGIPTVPGAPPPMGQIVPPSNPTVTGVGFGGLVNQPPANPAPGDKPKPPGDKPIVPPVNPPVNPPVVPPVNPPKSPPIVVVPPNKPKRTQPPDLGNIDDGEFGGGAA